jgi:hypothetical protein
MKKSIIAFLIAASAASSAFSQCISCDSSFSSISLNSSSIGKLDTASGHYSIAGGYLSKASGLSSVALGYKCHANNEDDFFSMAFGYQTTAAGRWSLAAGTSCNTSNDYALALGYNASALAQSNVAIGTCVTSSSYNTQSAYAIGTYLTNSGPLSMCLGIGVNNNLRLENDLDYCMLVGFNSTVPTLFIGPSPSSELEPDKTGKVGIGNVTSPLAKLHIKSDDDESASLFLEPSIWTISHHAEIFLGNLSHGMSAEKNKGLVFKTEKSYLFNQGNLGIGTEEPAAKVHIKSGDIYIEDINRGIIMKSPDGTCWRGTLNDQGQLIFQELIECPEDVAISIKESISNKLDIRIYPNPAKNIIEIYIPDLGVKSLTLKMVDQNGTAVKSLNINGIKTTVSIEDLVPGTYFCTFSGDNIYYVEKIVKF